MFAELDEQVLEIEPVVEVAVVEEQVLEELVAEEIVIEEVVEEVLQVKLSERATRLIDGDNEDSMEKKKTEGYF